MSSFPSKINIAEVVEYLDTVSLDSKIFIGCDSERHRKEGTWFADYHTVVVVHIDGKHGCKIFGAVDREVDYDVKKSRPKLRLMNEVYRVSGLYLELSQYIPHEIECHLDINPDEMHGSSCVITQAIGYIKGTCGVDPQVKPNAWCSSFAADRLKHILASA